jgi:glycosyltransferase involved in cell wall biosynthesis
VAGLSILFVIDGLDFGGGERVFLQLASGLRDRYQVSVATNTGGKFAAELKKLRIKLFSIDMTRQFSLKPVHQIRNIITHNKIDLIHSQGARADFFARLGGRLAGIRHILCTVAMPVEGFDVGPLRKSFYHLMDKLSGRYVERFIVVSDSLKKTITDSRRIPSQNIVRIYNGIELDHYQPELQNSKLRNSWGIPSSVPLIGAIGRLVWQKGFEYLIEAVPTILQVTPEARLVLVGDGPLRPDLENLARELDVHDRVIFTGFRSDIQNLLSTMDVLVVPSLLEGFPMITLEAMATAKPIVATQIQGIIEQISDGVEGILVPPNNPKAITAAVLRLMNDKELSSKLAVAARRKVESYFSVERMVRETETVYLSLLK